MDFINSAGAVPAEFDRQRGQARPPGLSPQVQIRATTHDAMVVCRLSSQPVTRLSARHRTFAILRCGLQPVP